MRRVHLAVGILMSVVFLITGQFMRHHQPPLGTLSDATRLMYRSRHIYILASGLVNLMLGIYLPRPPQGWRGIVRAVGSALLLVSPVLLLLAFVIESQRGFRPEMLCSAAGLYALFSGCMAHAAVGIGRRP
jgi:hypothetical protein